MGVIFDEGWSEDDVLTGFGDPHAWGPHYSTLLECSLKKRQSAIIYGATGSFPRV